MSTNPTTEARIELIATLRSAQSPWMHQAANEIEALASDLSALRIKHDTLLRGVGHPMWLPSVADALEMDDPFQATASEVLEVVRSRMERTANVANEMSALRIEHAAWGAVIDGLRATVADLQRVAERVDVLLDAAGVGRVSGPESSQFERSVVALIRERDNARAYVDDTRSRIGALGNLLCSNDSVLPQDIRDTVKLGHHVVDEAARVLLRVAGERDELRAALRGAYILGYHAGHEDTVEGRYTSAPGERWDEDEQLRTDAALAGGKS